MLTSHYVVAAAVAPAEALGFSTSDNNEKMVSVLAVF